MSQEGEARVEAQVVYEDQTYAQVTNSPVYYGSDVPDYDDPESGV